MDSLLFTVSAILPIILIVAVGYLLKRVGFVSPQTVTGGNKILFYGLLPALLFTNIYDISDLSEINLSFMVYAAACIVAAFLIGIPITALVTKEAKKRGPLLQSVFRSNFALIGIPLAVSLFGEEGGAVASIISAVAIPIFNLLAVISLSIFSDDKKVNVKKIVKGIVTNPLIISVLSGVAVLAVRSLLVKFNLSFRLSDVTPLFKALDMMGQAATPLALILLGAQFEFSDVKGAKKEILFSVLMRNVLVPLTVLLIACLATSFRGANIATLIALFGTPVAVSSVPMAQETGADSKLAGQLVVFTTLVSAFSLFILIFCLRYLGFLG